MGNFRNMMRDHFTQLPNELIEDSSISAKAFRVAAYLFSKPTGWNVRNADVMKRLSIKDRGSMAKYWKELLESGWLTRTRQRDDEGKISGGFDYQLNISPLIPTDDDGEDEPPTDFSKEGDKTGNSPNAEKTTHKEKPNVRKTPSLSNTDLNSNTNLSSNNPPKDGDDDFVVGIVKVSKHVFDWTNQLKSDTMALEVMAKNNRMSVNEVAGLVENFVEGKFVAEELRHKSYSGFKRNFNNWLPLRPANLKVAIDEGLNDCELTKDEISRYESLRESLKEKYPVAMRSIRFFKYSEFKKYIQRDFYPNYKFHYTERLFKSRMFEMMDDLEGKGWIRNKVENLFDFTKEYLIKNHDKGFYNPEKRVAA